MVNLISPAAVEWPAAKGVIARSIALNSSQEYEVGKKEKKKVKNKSTASGPPDFILAADIYLAKCFRVIKPEMDTSIIFSELKTKLFTVPTSNLFGISLFLNFVSQSKESRKIHDYI
ncbi:hypothetical protein D5086_008212 [Populus alba]|uniref:Uncharacterized protein n=1 Tax=Populus alba TaxID=43335 RepID=A0ACC4CFG0_POPAL